MGWPSVHIAPKPMSAQCRSGDGVLAHHHRNACTCCMLQLTRSPEALPVARATHATSSSHQQQTTAAQQQAK